MNPSETLLAIVIQSMTGQEEAKLTISFDLADGNIGDIFMKLDGVSSGRAADCVLWVIGKLMKFVGTGETVYIWNHSIQIEWPL